MNQPFPTDDAIPIEHRLAGRVDQTEYLIGGALRSWGGPRYEVTSPICTAADPPAPRTIGSFPMLDPDASLQALTAAGDAYDRGRGAWPTFSVRERIACVEDFMSRMGEQRDEVVRLIMWEIGKRYSDAAKEFDRTVEYIRGTVDALKDLDRASSRFQIAEGIFAQIRRAPLGIVLCMGPYNYPLNETFTTLIPALIMGNTVVFKPPRRGVLLHRPLLEPFRDAFPPGVVNTVYGDGEAVVTPLMRSGRVDVLAFIGTGRVADVIRSEHPHLHRLRCVLGLEAKNPAIVMPDADLDVAVEQCALGALSFNGQRCTALKILFVHESVADDFTERFCTTVDAMPRGMPWESGALITPLPDVAHVARMTRLMEDAVSKGARLANPLGGTHTGTLFHPAVLRDVTAEARLYTEEQFGPVVPIVTYRTIGEPIRYLVDSEYGQQVSLFGSDPTEIAALIDPLVNQVCRVNINSQCQRGPDVFPFTGRMGSAEGTLSVSDALRAFSIRTLVAAKGTTANKVLVNQMLHDRVSRFLSTDFIL